MFTRFILFPFSPLSCLYFLLPLFKLTVGIDFAAAAAAAKSCQSCLTLCNPIDGSPLGSPVPGILQARTLEWGAISFSGYRLYKILNSNSDYQELVV